MIPVQDPKAMTQGAGEEPSLRRRYDRKPEAAPTNPPIQYNMIPSDQDVEEEPVYDQRLPSEVSNVVLDDEDDAIFEGGPRESDILSWKKQFNNRVFLMEVNEDVFVFRPLTRYEYKQIVAIPNLNPLAREEILCETCVLWPADINWQTVADMEAGVPALVSEQILEKSGFTKNIQVTPL